MIFKRLGAIEEQIRRMFGRLASIAKHVAENGQRIDLLEERLKALEDAINDGESQRLRAEKDYIDGMYNLLNYDIGMAKKPKGRELNE